MTQKERSTETLILISLGKAFTEQATFLTKELKQKDVQTFNGAVLAVNLFIKTVSAKHSPAEVDHIEKVTDIYHNINLEIRKTTNGI